ncbi:hypothetical protein [Streptomyces sp. NPDC098781]|uniref:hypothetical protein n=1 Tax=Streptomyces sp. NPDC098781 TaxID=3366097 RepID=UPI0037F156A4
MDMGTGLNDGGPERIGDELLATSIVGHGIRRISADSLEAALSLAGEDRVELPVLSAIVDPGCRLAYSPSTRMVLWATPQDDGRWGVAEVEPDTVITCVPHAVHVQRAVAEYKVLSRAGLPADSIGATRRIPTLVAQLHRRIGVLEEIYRDEHKADPENIAPWPPIDNC